MTNHRLLLARLDEFNSDIVKVSKAVEQAKQRGVAIDALHKQLATGSTPLSNRLLELKGHVDEVSRSLQGEEIREALGDDTILALVELLVKVSTELGDITTRVTKVRDGLRRIKATIVTLDDTFTDQVTLTKKCNELHTKVTKLRVKVKADTGSGQRKLWAEYERLLTDDGRPLFSEYVDFLGGLTVRDTGLDDRVCEMTDVLLAGMPVVGPHLPIPSRTAALSSALDSVVKLGFPEWTVWGVPLVAHEAGLAVTRNLMAFDVQECWRTGRPMPHGSSSQSCSPTSSAPTHSDWPMPTRH